MLTAAFGPFACQVLELTITSQLLNCAALPLGREPAALRKSSADFWPWAPRRGHLQIIIWRPADLSDPSADSCAWQEMGDDPPSKCHGRGPRQGASPCRITRSVKTICRLRRLPLSGTISGLHGKASIIHNAETSAVQTGFYSKAPMSIIKSVRVSGAAVSASNEKYSNCLMIISVIRDIQTKSGFT